MPQLAFGLIFSSSLCKKPSQKLWLPQQNTPPTKYPPSNIMAPSGNRKKQKLPDSTQNTGAALSIGATISCCYGRSTNEAHLNAPRKFQQSCYQQQHICNRCVAPYFCM
ncbi:hypothetical protein Tcan_00792, partial [Toxocara canis]